MTKEQEFRKQTEEAKFEAFALMCEKITKLEKENTLLGKRCNQLLKDKGELIDKCKELDAQIEKIKRYLDCEYCEHYTQPRGCKNCNEEIRSDWKLKEIKEND